jgi:transcriptional regulator with XRE-family HTH domain
VSEDDPGGNDVSAMPLHELIRMRMRQRGWSYSDLERVSGKALTRGRWQQLGSGVHQRKFPDPASLTIIAQVLDVDITTVVLAAARTLGLRVESRRTGLSDLMPEQTELLSESMRDAILALVRAAVADASGDDGAGTRPASLGGLRLEWPKSAAPSQSSG